MLKFQIQRARDWYQKAEDGIPMLAPDAQLPIRASLDMYSTILNKIEDNDYDNFNKRAYTAKYSHPLYPPPPRLHPLALRGRSELAYSLPASYSALAPSTPLSTTDGCHPPLHIDACFAVLRCLGGEPSQRTHVPLCSVAVQVGEASDAAPCLPSR